MMNLVARIGKGAVYETLEQLIGAFSLTVEQDKAAMQVSQNTINDLSKKVEELQKQVDELERENESLFDQDDPEV